MNRLALLALLLLLASCAATTAPWDIHIVQEWTPCARPSRPVYWPWDANASMCSDYNLEATVTNWIMAQRYCESLESALDCYSRQMGHNATGAGE